MNTSEMLKTDPTTEDGRKYWADRGRREADEAPDVTIARLIEKALVCADPDNRRADALPLIEHLVNGADRLAREVMDEDETNTFTVHLESALAILDVMD